jgi:AcrR family transcriptional regulator
MLHWTISFQTPGAARMDELLSAGVRRRMRAISLESAHTVSARPDGEQVADERSRLMHEVLRLALHDYRALTAPQIADEANVPIDAFLDLFATPDECYLAALETISEQLLGIAEDPGLSGGDWPVAVRHGVSRLLSHLGAHPLQARTIGQAAFTAGPDAVRRTLEITEALARRLTDSAPAIADGDFAIHAIAGALMHTVRCQVLSGRIQLLGVLSDHLSYVVLAPYIGAEAALDVISTEASV